MRIDQPMRPIWQTQPTRLLLGLALLAVALPSIASCGSNSNSTGMRASQSLPTGWSLYRDAKLLFQIPMPPNWQVASLNDGPLDNEQCIYGVDFFPPGAQVDLTKAGQIHEAWLVKIDVNHTCPPWQSSDDHWLIPEAHPIIVSGVNATAYDDEDNHFVVERVIVATFGGHQFRFMVHSYKSPDETKQVYALFDQMLRGFQYEGS